MLILNDHDALHRAWLLRLLSAIADDRSLVALLRFKGGTCAALRDLLNRFSVDLDFDLLEHSAIAEVRERLEMIFTVLDLSIKDKSNLVPQYFLKYPNKTGKRNTIAIDITSPPTKANIYEMVKISDIDRFVPCQTIATMVAHKLVTPLDRFEKHGSIAGRDIFDIHRFLCSGLLVNEAVIEERTGLSPREHYCQLYDFIERRVTQTILDQDLNPLLPPNTFKDMRKNLKQEVLNEVKHLAGT